MPISWNEIRARAARFADEWKDAHYEKGQTQTFYNEFFEVFGRRRRDVAVYEQKVKKLSDTQGFIDLFWPGQLLVEQKSAGRNLALAREQATDYFVTLKERERPRYILLSDFQSFELLDLETREERKFPLSQLTDNIESFAFIAGYNRLQYKDQDPANIQAATLMRNLHNQLEESGYVGTDLERLLVRVMFCLFADDTAIFNPDSFLRYIEDRSSEDGSDLGSRLIHLFEILDTPEMNRQRNLDEELAQFPYINGQLFAERIRTPSFDSDMRDSLLKCCYFNWSKVSPALFGSLFQTVMLPEEQRKGGAHYTSERNILKTIHPLFLDELYDEFNRIKSDRSTQRLSRLNKFHDKLASLTFLDPACGCGNFLILAYRELRLLEIELLKAIHTDRQQVLDITHLSRLDVDQFYGIEIEEFPVRIAEAAMWLVDHQMNIRLSEAFGQAFARLPLAKSAHITHGNALTIEWSDIIPPAKLSYILGNPPFVGKQLMSPEQNADLKKVFHNLKGAGVLDYVTAWYWKAANFIQGTPIKVVFVSTNSITQGEQVPVLWQPLLARLNITIHFAHTTFKWTIDERQAKGMHIANVFCVIIGFAAYTSESKFLFEYEHLTAEPHRLRASNINPYLIDGANTVIPKHTKSICNVPQIRYGSKPVDGGYFVLSTHEKEELLMHEPDAAQWIRPYIGTDELLYNIDRSCLWLEEITPRDLRLLPMVLQRVNNVKEFRLKSTKIPTREAAKNPTSFAERRQPKSRYLAIPEVSAETRLYIPIAFLDANVIASNLLYTVADASIYHFAILTSAMHIAWVSTICGRLKSDFRYSSRLVYNTFPWPESPTQQKIDSIEAKAQIILDIRAKYTNSSLADLYDPVAMPADLRRAHEALDKSVEAAYRKKAFSSKRERVEFLFAQYQRLTAPLLPVPNKGSRK